jgi:hypothetical protein
MFLYFLQQPIGFKEVGKEKWFWKLKKWSETSSIAVENQISYFCNKIFELH